MKDHVCLPGMDSAVAQSDQPSVSVPVALEQLRFHRPDRSQIRLVACSLEETIAPNHHVRLIWELVEQLDLSAFAVGLKAQQGRAGRSATDVRLLVALWLWAATDGVGSAREVARLCAVHEHTDGSAAAWR